MTIMFRNMLVATDLSEASEQVIGTVAGFRAFGTRRVVLVYCIGIRDAGVPADGLMDLARPSLERQKKLLEEQGFQVKTKLVLGLPQVEINRQADEHRCSLIVVGSHGRTMAGEIMLGGVACAVVYSARRPVLLLRVRLKDEQGAAVGKKAAPALLEHVLFPTDFSDNAEHAFSYLKKIARCGAERITLLHVQDQGRIDRHLRDRLEEFNRIDTGRLERLKAELTKRGVQSVGIELLYGSPKQEIIERTKRDHVSLVVMGSQGRGYVAELFLGSVSHAVARRSSVPVLLIPAIL